MKTVLNLNGQQVQAEHRGFKPIQEPVSVYELDDGTLVRVRLVVTDIFLLDTTDDVTGVPRPFVQFQPIASVVPAETAVPGKANTAKPN